MMVTIQNYVLAENFVHVMKSNKITVCDMKTVQNLMEKYRRSSRYFRGYV